MKTANLFCLCLFILLVHCKSPENKISEPFNLDTAPTELGILGEGVISTDLYERDFALSPDGSEIVFTLGNYNQSIRCLVTIKKEGDQWGEKQVLPFSGEFMDIEPFFDPNGSRIYFASKRPIYGDDSRSDYNLWYCDRTDSGWGEAQALDSVINSRRDEYYPAVSQEGNLYFTAVRPEGAGREDIYRSAFVSGKFQEPLPLDTAINSEFFEFNAFINPAENLLLFSSFGRPDGLGGGDLYMSRKLEDGTWSKAQNLGPTINSTKLDYCPFFDESRDILFFSSDRSAPFQGKLSHPDELETLSRSTLNGLGNLYWMKMNGFD